MKLFFAVEIPSGARLSPFCLDFHELNRKIQSSIFSAVVVNTICPELPVVQRLDESQICAVCAAPLLPSGACSSRNCPSGRLPRRKPSAAALAATVPGVKIGSKLKKG